MLGRRRDKDRERQLAVLLEQLAQGAGERLKSLGELEGLLEKQRKLLEEMGELARDRGELTSRVINSMPFLAVGSLIAGFGFGVLVVAQEVWGIFIELTGAAVFSVGFVIARGRRQGGAFLRDNVKEVRTGVLLFLMSAALDIVLWLLN